MYAKFLKRMIDVVIALCMIIVLTPFLLFFAVAGTFKMKGNPFFCQQRVGKNEKIFKMIKLRTMTNERDSSGNLLPDEVRLTKYGHFLRSTSIDELPELFNILRGEMAIIGPRPLLVQYLPFYTDEERKRHNVRPGLTGLAQINGRNFQSWEKRFSYDLEYVRTISFKKDLEILIKTIRIVLNRDGIGDLEPGKYKEDMAGQQWVFHDGQWHPVCGRLDEERSVKGGDLND